jgi:hypothetical protein
MLGLLFALVVVGSIIWVGVDSSKRDWSDVKGSGGTSTTTWVVGCALLWIVIFPMYLFKRGNAPFKTETAASTSASTAQMYRECPHCKEAMRRDAQTCPHCRQLSTPWQFHDGHWWYRSAEQAPWHWLDEQTGAWVAAT